MHQGLHKVAFDGFFDGMALCMFYAGRIFGEGKKVDLRKDQKNVEKRNVDVA